MSWDRPIFAAASRGPYAPFQVHQGFLTPRQCARATAHGFDAEPVEAEVIGVDGADSGALDVDIRRSATSWIAPHASTEWLFTKLAKLAEKANRSYGFDLTGFAEDVQFTVYDAPGSFYTWHQDGLDGMLADRKLTIVVQLSDPGDYVGGELQFFDVVESYDRDELVEFSTWTAMQGTAIVFPSFEHHRVLPVIEGRRCSLVAWVAGPPFR